MFLTNPEDVKKYTAPYRLWQGIPGIEVTKGGRIFLTFYSGGISEAIGNYCLLFCSNDGVCFDEVPIAVTVKKDHRCYDPCLWIDPLGRLWFIWSCAPKHSVWAVICEDPDAPTISFGEPFQIGQGVMLNKPTVLSTGEWLFPIAVWQREPKSIGIKQEIPPEERKAFVYKSIDNGKTFVNIGGADVKHRYLDEHMLLELQDEYLAMFVRTTYGIGVAYSYDRGKTWTDGKDSGIRSTSSRFFIRRLKSGRILLVTHDTMNERSHLTAMLSEDEGRSWSHKLLLDERSNISYPDAVEAEDGFIYITYDRERGSFARSLEEVYESAREILIAKITEEEIIQGAISNPKSRLKWVVSSLGRYAMEENNPFRELTRLSENELVKILLDKSSEEVFASLFECYQVNCINMHNVDNDKLDALIEKLENNPENKEELIRKMIALVRSVSHFEIREIPIVEKIKNIVQSNLTEEVPVKEIAERVGISQYYMCHLFKKTTGLTITDYKNEMKITKAKELLVHSDKKIADVSYECGFGSESYFSKLFLESEKISPSSYRKLLKRKK